MVLVDSFPVAAGSATFTASSPFAALGIRLFTTNPLATNVDTVALQLSVAGLADGNLCSGVNLRNLFQMQARMPNNGFVYGPAVTAVASVLQGVLLLGDGGTYMFNNNRQLTISFSNLPIVAGTPWLLTIIGIDTTVVTNKLWRYFRGASGVNGAASDMPLAGQDSVYFPNIANLTSVDILAGSRAIQYDRPTLGFMNNITDEAFRVSGTAGTLGEVSAIDGLTTFAAGFTDALVPIPADAMSVRVAGAAAVDYLYRVSAAA